jgi:hypothetical protein
MSAKNSSTLRICGASRRRQDHPAAAPRDSLAAAQETPAATADIYEIALRGDERCA